MGSKFLKPEQESYLDWVARPSIERQPPTKQAKALELNVDPSTLWQWEQTPWYREELERRLQNRNVGPERLQEVMDSLWKEAKSGDVSAAKLYLQYVQEMGGNQNRLEDRAVSEMTDEELQTAWEDTFVGD